MSRLKKNFWIRRGVHPHLTNLQTLLLPSATARLVCLVMVKILVNFTSQIAGDSNDIQLPVVSTHRSARMETQLEMAEQGGDLEDVWSRSY